ncbi:uncharacterized protein LOC117646363 [Thrips palmi]|uniref:Uncharacterized protein LOC117646363 n=1 Tax=Thrips palmi TaxID=161013 RepID=A0A6P8YZN9_THRPL|nr:uncharacterized protein LOC117646363 [Thrips palmi]
MGGRAGRRQKGVAAIIDELIRGLPSSKWSQALHLLGLLFSLLAQVSFLVSFGVSFKKQSYDQSAVALFFVLGFCCVDYGLWIRGRRGTEAMVSLASLVDVLRSIETLAQDKATTAVEDKPGRRRALLMERVLQPLAIVSRTQSAAVSAVMVGLFLVSGSHFLPHWPTGNGHDLWEVAFMLLHSGLICLGGTPYVILIALSWMSSLSMDVTLHLLADNVREARAWQELLPIIRLHQQLHDAFARVQGFFAEDMSVLTRIVFGLGVIGLLRAALGTHDMTNLAIVALNFSHIAMACLSGELQESAGDDFHDALCGCDWAAWPVADRTALQIVLTRTITPVQVKFRYFGAMRLVTLTNIFNSLFRCLQVLRANLESTKWG